MDNEKIYIIPDPEMKRSRLILSKYTIKDLIYSIVLGIIALFLLLISISNIKGIFLYIMLFVSLIIGLIAFLSSNPIKFYHNGIVYFKCVIKFLFLKEKNYRWGGNYYDIDEKIEYKK